MKLKTKKKFKEEIEKITKPIEAENRLSHMDYLFLARLILFRKMERYSDVTSFKEEWNWHWLDELEKKLRYHINKEIRSK